jgi:hypothetical protein
MPFRAGFKGQTSKYHIKSHRPQGFTLRIFNPKFGFFGYQAQNPFFTLTHLFYIILAFLSRINEAKITKDLDIFKTPQIPKKASKTPFFIYFLPAF